MFTVSFTLPMSGDKTHTIQVNDLDEWNAILVAGGLFDIHVHLEETQHLVVIAYPIERNAEGIDVTNCDTWEHGANLKLSGPRSSEVKLHNGFYYWKEEIEAEGVWVCSQCGSIEQEDDEEFEDGICKYCHRDFEANRCDCPRCERRIDKEELTTVDGETCCSFCEHELTP